MTESPSLLPRPLRVLAGRALQGALNRAVDLDPDTRQRLAALEGRRVVLHVHGPELALSVHVEDGRLHVGPPPADGDIEGPTLRIKATPGSLLAMALRRDEDGIAPGQVEIAGDAGLARQLEKLARGYAPDMEEAFAQRFGDVIGVPVAQALRRGATHARRAARHAVEDTADWLREESRLAVAPDEMDAFLDEVDALRERAERLEARLNRLARRPGPDA